MFPIQDVRGRIIAFGGRVLDDSKPKYINSPENLVYSKGRNLFGLFNAKKGDTKKILIVEGYMDVISLHQRGITNVVASLGTALTEAQGRLLRKYAEQIIISYDSDSAGQAATLRGLEILRNLGCDVRILQMEGAKDPDEYVIKYGTGRFNLLIDNAISLVEFKVKVLKNKFDLDNTNDKIKFLQEIAKVLSEVDSQIELEIYVEKIANEYSISKEAIYSEVNKIKYANTAKKEEPEKIIRKKQISKKSKVDDSIIKKENVVIYLLLNYPEKVTEKIRSNLFESDFKYDINKKIINKLYELIDNKEKISSEVLNYFTDDDEITSHITMLMADDYEIGDVDKCIDDIINSYNKDRLIDRRNDIIQSLENDELTKEEKASLEKELSSIVMKLARMK